MFPFHRNANHKASPSFDGEIKESRRTFECWISAALYRSPRLRRENRRAPPPEHERLPIPKERHELRCAIYITRYFLDDGKVKAYEGACEGCSDRVPMCQGRAGGWVSDGKDRHSEVVYQRGGLRRSCHKSHPTRHPERRRLHHSDSQTLVISAQLVEEPPR